jgi:lysophospholipase-2
MPLNLPTEHGRTDPIHKPATQPCQDIKNSAVFIFNHGLADSAVAIENVADQFQNGGKLPYMTWILPNAKKNNITLDRAWFTPHGLPFLAPSRPELNPDEDEEGMLESVAYLETVIDAVIASGVPPHRIVLGGFSQGCAMSILTHLTSKKYSGKLGGIVGLLGWLLLWDGTKRIMEIRKENGLEEVPSTPMFLARGTSDEFVGKRQWMYTLEGLKEMNIPNDSMDAREYRKLTHTLNGPVLRDMCEWLEKVLPPLE